MSDSEAHEPACVIRLLKSGWSLPQIGKELLMSQGQLDIEIKLAHDEWNEAKRLGMVTIYDLPKEESI